LTHPLTPREKVLLKPCPFCGGEAWLNDYEAKYSDLPPKSRSPQCRSCGASLGYLTTPAKATEAWNRRTALASGSGDHAELARLAEAAKRVRRDAVGRLDGDDAHRIWFAFLDSVSPATVLALLAENAALRAANTEAERKLAEAVGLNDRAAELMRQCTDPERFEGVSTLNVYANMRAWLSDLPPAPGAEA